MQRFSPLLHFITILLLSSCGGDVNPATVTEASEILPTVAVEPTEQAPAIAIVNGEAISEESFERQLALYRQAQLEVGQLLASEEVERIVLDDLIARMLLAQAAREAGFLADAALVSERLSTLIEEAGGQSAYEDWLTEYGYDADSFAEELKLEIEASWMRNEISAAVPTQAEQVLARQLLLSERFQAERLLTQLQGGTPFEIIVVNNDPQRLGSLGWFPRGYLFQVEVEEAAFALQAGEFSEIVESEFGFHLIEVIDRDPERELSPQARLQLQMKALEDWLAQELQQSDIEVFLP